MTLCIRNCVVWTISATTMFVPLVVKECRADHDTVSQPTHFAKWSRIELTMIGPASNGRGEPNPFSFVVNVEFIAPRGRTFRVPAFFDGDGKGGLGGHVWKVRFSADEVGEWKYRSSSPIPQLDGVSGRFTVTEVPEDARGFWKWGRLESTGTAENSQRYLRFRDGPYWLKAGCDDPENFLGAYKNYDTLDKRIAAIDYLTERGINSLYIMTHNVDGDDNDVWPWLGETSAAAKRHARGDVRFDVAKLEQWRLLLEHMQTGGVVPYLVLEDDSAFRDYDHDRYYREIVARYGYLPAVVFNLGEEHNENYSLAEGLALARRLKEIDPYDHPLAIHNVNRPHDDYINSSAIDLTSIQTGQPGTRRGVKDATEHNTISVDWLDRCRQLGARPLVINFDEGRPELDRRAWWSAYLGGGVWEAHVVEPYDQPMSAWEETWTQLGGARAFMRSLPFHEMEPRNDLVESGRAFCLANPGRVYAAYLPEGGEMTLQLDAGKAYVASWWNPENGFNGRFQDEHGTGGGRQRFVAPGRNDWALRVVAINAQTSRPSQPSSGSAEGIAATYYPPSESEGGWRKLDSAEEIRRVGGMEPARLEELKQWLLDSDKRDFAAVVIRNGHIVLEVERGNSAKTDSRRVASVSKALCATVLAIAAERSRQGRTPRKMTFDDPAFDFIPWAQPLSDPRKAMITVKQLLNHTSGLTPEATGARNQGPWRHMLGHDGDPLTAKLAFDPGTKCGYSTFGLYHAALVCEDVTGKPYDEFAIESLFKPIGCEHWWFQHFGGDENGDGRYGRHPSHAMGMPARDLARVAYCMLRNGGWNEQQVIPSWFVRETAAPTHDVKTPELRFNRAAESFSHGWELPARLTGGAGEGIPHDARFKPGSGGQLIAFVPSLELVVTRQTGSSGAWEYEEYLRRACRAVRND